MESCIGLSTFDEMDSYSSSLKQEMNLARRACWCDCTTSNLDPFLIEQQQKQLHQLEANTRKQTIIVAASYFESKYDKHAGVIRDSSSMLLHHKHYSQHNQYHAVCTTNSEELKQHYTTEVVNENVAKSFDHNLCNSTLYPANNISTDIVYNNSHQHNYNDFCKQSTIVGDNAQEAVSDNNNPDNSGFMFAVCAFYILHQMAAIHLKRFCDKINCVVNFKSYWLPSLKYINTNINSFKSFRYLTFICLLFAICTYHCTEARPNEVNLASNEHPAESFISKESSPVVSSSPPSLMQINGAVNQQPAGIKDSQYQQAVSK